MHSSQYLYGTCQHERTKTNNLVLEQHARESKVHAERQSKPQEGRPVLSTTSIILEVDVVVDVPGASMGKGGKPLTNSSGIEHNWSTTMLKHAIAASVTGRPAS